MVIKASTRAGFAAFEAYFLLLRNDFQLHFKKLKKMISKTVKKVKQTKMFRIQIALTGCLDCLDAGLDMAFHETCEITKL